MKIVSTFVLLLGLLLGGCTGQPSALPVNPQAGSWRAWAGQVIAHSKTDDQLPPWNGVIPVGAGHWTGEKPVEPPTTSQVTPRRAVRWRTSK